MKRRERSYLISKHQRNSLALNGCTSCWSELMLWKQATRSFHKRPPGFEGTHCLPLIASHAEAIAALIHVAQRLALTAHGHGKKQKIWTPSGVPLNHSTSTVSDQTHPRPPQPSTEQVLWDTQCEAQHTRWRCRIRFLLLVRNCKLPTTFLHLGLLRIRNQSNLLIVLSIIKQPHTNARTII